MTPIIEAITAAAEAGFDAPKELLVLDWDRTGMAWLGSWYPDPLLRGVWRRLVLEGPANIATASVSANDDGFTFVAPVYPRPTEANFPTPEAAQQACEAAIVAAWRNR